MATRLSIGGLGSEYGYYTLNTAIGLLTRLLGSEYGHQAINTATGL